MTTIKASSHVQNDNNKGKQKNQSFSKLVEEMRSRLQSIRNDPAMIEPAIKECGKHIRAMNAALKKATSVGVKQHIMGCTALMTGFRSMMKVMRGVTGSGYQPSNYVSSRVKWIEQTSAFASRMRTGVIINIAHKDPAAFLEDAERMLKRRIMNILKKETAVKVCAVFCGEFLITKADEEIRNFKYITTKNLPIYRETKEWFETIRNSILAQLEEFQEKDSGWALSNIVNVTFNINKFTPQLGSSYIELPEYIKAKEACINIKNKDDACFAWAVTSALHPNSLNADRVSSYPHYTTVLNLKNLTMPMTIKQVPRFERQNDISVNVYILEKAKRNKFNVVPTYLTKNKQPKHVNLLMLQDVYYDDDDEDAIQPRCHYVWVKNLSRLLSSQLSKRNGQKYFCDRCLHYFKTAYKLELHVEDCVNMNECKVRLPKQGETIKFKNYKNKEPAPFIVFADVECLLEPVCNKNNQLKTEKLQTHTPYSIGYYVKCFYDDTLSFYKAYRGVDCRQWFAHELKQLAENVETVFLCPLPMEPLTPSQKVEFNSISHCHICEQTFSVSDNRVRDHCHLTGKYRGAAHEKCNLEYQDSHVIPVVFHNLSGYDSHFIIKNLAKDIEGRIDLLPINKERYISFTKHIDENLVKFRFIDSFRFLAEGLSKLASYLKSFPNLQSQFTELDDNKINLLTRKGVFPYDYLDTWGKLNESQLPTKTKFYNSMTDTDITDDDYTHAHNVWNSFGCRNLGDYSDLYLKTDVMLLADVFEQFRVSCLKTYSLDPAHYFTLPGYTWDCMLKHVQTGLELLSDIDMVMFIERGIRGGLSQCSKRYAAANNKYMSNYNAEKPSIFLMHDDINNQYGWAMSQHLPYGGFEWIEVDDLSNINFNIPADNPVGYILEVDLEYPDSIHNTHNDLPFCPEHLAPPKSREIKLMATLLNKERYVIHYLNLQQALENGLKLGKIHRVLKFNQSAWLKSYIDLNTKLRTNALNDFEKNLFKLMNNAVFGKTMENIRNHSNIKLVSKWEGRHGAEVLISRPNFKSSTIFEENLVAIELNKTEVYFNKPIYVGMCILDISKIKLYQFHYSYMRNRFGDKARVCYVDTDSLIYEVETPDLYEVMRCDAQNYYDTSDYPDNNIYNIPRLNKKVLGMMKDENFGKVMTEMVGVRSKMYAERVEGIDAVKKAKGVKRHIVKNSITFDDYLECLQQNRETTVQQKLFRSDKHEVSTVRQTKIALSPHDDKRYICSDGIHTLSWGHYSIRESS